MLCPTDLPNPYDYEDLTEEEYERRKFQCPDEAYDEGRDFEDNKIGE
jgi:hypothetical protein